MMSSDGSEVFFDSTATLLPGVVNEGVVDVYEWQADGSGLCTESPGCTYLISGGNSAEGSYLIGSSADGSNVFFLMMLSWWRRTSTPREISTMPA